MTSMTTSSCLCGAIRLSFSLDNDQIVAKFLCHCTDDRKITGSMFATNLILKATTLSQLPSFSSSPSSSSPTTAVMSTYTKTADSGHIMTSHFCPACATTLYRTSSGFPGMVVIKVGTVDDLALQEGLGPEVEQFTRTRAGWLGPMGGAREEVGNYFC